MGRATYSLATLSEVSGVPERTIRFYITEGLIGKPVGSGRGAYYTDVHRSRLTTIRTLKESGMGLPEIRKYLMMAGPDEEVKVVSLYQKGKVASTSLADNLVEARSDLGEAAESDSPLEALNRLLEAELDDSRAAKRVSSSTQSELPITPDLSLLLKGQFAEEELAQFEHLAGLLRELLTGRGT